MKNNRLKEMAIINNITITKLSNDENVTMEVMAKICRALNCTMDEITLDDEKDK